MNKKNNKAYILPLITLLCGLLISFFYFALHEQINKTSAAVELKLKREFFPQAEFFQNYDPAFEMVYNANKELIGYMLHTYDNGGYGGEVKFLVALDTDFSILDYKMTAHQETPGLGTRVNDPAFRAAFRGAFPFPDFLPLTKNEFPEKLGISALSGATITSVAASRALASHTDKYIHLLYAPMWSAVLKAFEQYEQNNPTPWPVRRWRERYIQQAQNEINQGASQ